MLKVKLKNESKTLLLGSAIGKTIKNLDFKNFEVHLNGDLGAGKTTLVRGILQNLNWTDVVTSPSYTLCEEYEISGRLLLHVDLYRISDESELADLDILDNLNVTICIIEWPEIMGSLVPSRHISMKVFLNEIDYHSRNIVFEMHGNGWELIFKNFVERLSSSN